MPSGVYQHKPWTDEQKAKLRELRSSKPNPWLGRKHRPESIEKVKLARRKQVFSDETRAKLSRLRKGKPLSLEHAAHIRQAQKRGAESHLWRGGVTPLNMKIRMSVEYKTWRRAVLKRDASTCIWCGETEGRIEADHIKPFSLYLESRFDVNNGRTLCWPCHRTTDTYGGRLFKQIKERFTAVIK